MRRAVCFAVALGCFGLLDAQAPPPAGPAGPTLPVPDHEIALIQETPPGPQARPLDSKITAVTLYSNQALVVRRGPADAPAGRSRWTIGPLPAGMQDEAVRARIVSGAARLANLEVLLKHETIFRKKEAEEAEARLKEIQARHKAASDALSALEREVAFLRGLQVGKAPDGRPEKPTPAPIEPGAWAATLQFVDEAFAANRKRAREIAAEIDGIEEELAVAADHARKLASGKVESQKSVVVELEADAGGAVELELAYLVPGPGWWPRYDVRADVEKGNVELTSYALVRQETGEDWSDVELTFSAAEPARAADLPELLAWRIGEEPSAVAQQQRLTVASSFGLELQPQASEKEQLRTKLASLEPRNQDLARRLNERGSSVDVQVAQSLNANLEAAGKILQQQGQQESKDKAVYAFKRSRAAKAQDTLKRIDERRKQNDLALQKNDWNEVALGNSALQAEIQGLGDRYQTYFADDLLGCATNIERAGRNLKTLRLADGIIAPVQSSRGYDFKYAALRRETVPSDGAFNKVVIGVEEFKVEFIYEAVPELSRLAFLTTRIKNARRQPYLDGPASVFLGPDFVGDGRVPTTARGEEFPVSLGADESISIVRKSERKRETTGLFTSYHRYQHTVDLVVKNQKGRKIRVALVDRVPFSEEKRVKVVRGELPRPPMREDRKGLLRWELDLAPGQEDKWSFAYSVELPADQQLVEALDPSVKW